LEHVRDDKEAVKEWKNSLKKNGHVIITVPAFQRLWSVHDVLNAHIRRYDRKLFLELLKNLDINVIKLSYWNFFLFWPAALFKLIGKTRKSKSGDIMEIGKPLNKILTSFLSIDNALIKNMNLPVGTSLICVARKN